MTDISVELLFFVLEINRIDDARLDEQLRSAALAHYRPWLEQVRVFRPHQLADELERLLHEKSVTGHRRLVAQFRRDASSISASRSTARA